MNTEDEDTVELALKAILDNVPWSDASCAHVTHFEDFVARDGHRGVRLVTPCSAREPYRLCWFHIVLANCEHLRKSGIKLITTYLLILGFKIVARSVSDVQANNRWLLFKQVNNTL